MTLTLTSPAARRWQVENGTLVPNAWASNTDEWDAHRYMLEFWGITEGRVLRQYAGQYSEGVLRDILDIALDALIKTANMFHAWCADNALSADDKLLFWNLLKKRIKWDIAAYLSDAARQPSDLSIQALDEQFPGSVFTEMSVRQRDSLLHSQLCDFIGRLSDFEQTLLALVYFDSVGVKEIARLTGQPDSSNLAQLRQRAVRKIHAYSLTQVSDVTLPTYLPARRMKYADALNAVVVNKFGVSPDVYTALALRAYRLDVSYVVEMIDAANGHRRMPGARRSHLDPATLAEIERRYRNGETQQSIADSLGLTASNVYKALAAEALPLHRTIESGF